MTTHSIYLSKLTDLARQGLEHKLWERQTHRCFLCDKDIDLQLHQNELHIDHVIPIVHQGPDDPMNFAIMHGTCNEKKSAANLEIARLLNLFESIQERARKENRRSNPWLYETGLTQAIRPR